MDLQTKINFAGNFLAVVLTGAAMLIGSIVFPPAGLVILGAMIFIVTANLVLA